jgi:2-polyprenyl-3-methyl-5-hydroxy-6-metoxy-1,4-benzoquinol methylase
MDIELIKQKKSEIVKRFGPWTAHNIKLADDIYTIDERVSGDEIKLRRIIQIISDIHGGSLENLRVLDLACLEGLYATELARHGAKAVGIEGREANFEKARFTKDILSLDNLELFCDDVKNLSKEKYGNFDVVLCLGILYHLDVPDVFSFIENIARVCDKFAIIDTHISLTDKKSCVYKEKKYWGKTIVEHSAGSTPKERDDSLWSSIDNLTSFWLTRPSLLNLLSHVGFTSVYECYNPPELKKPDNRTTLLAIKGQNNTLISSPLVNDLPEENWPEKQQNNKRSKNMLKKFGRLLPKKKR